MTELDSKVITKKLRLFNEWYDTGAPVFDRDDYAVLFQAGTFEYGRECEKFCEAVYKYGPVPESPRST